MRTSLCKKLFFNIVLAMTIHISGLYAADTCFAATATQQNLVSGTPITKTGSITLADEYDYFEFVVPSAGTISLNYTSSENITFQAGTTGCPSSNILNIANNNSGSATAYAVTANQHIYVMAKRKSLASTYSLTISYASNLYPCHAAANFFDINGSETSVTGKSTLGGESIPNTGKYYKFNATNAGGDINGTLKINSYSDNFNLISHIKFVDQNCNLFENNTSFSSTNVTKWTMAQFFNTSGTWYLYIDDSENYNPSVVTSMLWYPDVNVTTGGGSTPVYYEPAIFKGTDTPKGNPLAPIKTKIVQKPHNIAVHVVKDDGTIYTQFKGSFKLDLVDSTNYPATECKMLPILKYNGILGIDSNDNGMMETGDNTTAHGPSLIYDHAHRNARYRMTYLVDPTAGGIINYDDLLLQSGCVGNTQACLWGVLTSLANGDDPYLPDFTIADVCGMHCQPGAGTGNNQVSADCAQCVFGQFGYSDCSDNFAIRPDHFDNNLTAGQVLVANTNIPLSFHANAFGGGIGALDYNESEIQTTPYPASFVIDANISNSSKICQVPSMHFSPRIAFTDGNVTGDYSLSNVGDLNVTMHEIVGSEFGYVDRFDSNDTTRLITPKTVQVKVIPHHFAVDGNFTNGSNGFTYLSNYETYPTIESRTISALLDLNVTAKDPSDNNLSNYTNTCYAKDGNVTLNLASAVSISPVGSLSKLIWYDTNHDLNGSIPLGGTAYKLKMFAAQFDSNDSNGTAHMKYRINYDRNQTMVVDPFLMTSSSIVIDDNHSVSGTLTLDRNVTYLYGRIIPRDTRVFGTTVDSIASAWYEVYNEPAIDAIALQRSRNDTIWYINGLHNDTGVDGDANVTQWQSGSSQSVALATPIGATAVNGVETYNFGPTPLGGYKAHIDTVPWLWYGVNALTYVDPVTGNTEADCLRHPCFNLSVVPAVGATGSTRSSMDEGSKSSKKSESTGAWKSHGDYAPAIK